ncbi:hypothetical protein EDD11_000289 [Mortierella claussenii]|nr:hypothetical protein EDD11_000289 [Mortierella claussenii]
MSMHHGQAYAPALNNNHSNSNNNSNNSASSAKGHAQQTHIMSDRGEDVSKKDDFGVSPLHRAVATNNIELVQRLLRHPKVDVNDKDLESGWTALHRALYLGHLRIALLLIQHKDINMTIEDKDRNTAVDLCQATLPVSSKRPVFLKTGLCPGDALYTWGSNSNFTLGHNDGDDRKQPELVKFPYQTSTITFPRAKSAKTTLLQLSMSKFHTAIATSEVGFTAKIWGFGTNGRIGSDRKMQLSPAPVSGISGSVEFTALGRDHTVFVTSKGEVYTLGNNKYGQLGYALEIPKDGQDPIQYSPKKVVLTIAKLKIVGAAASRWHTVVHTDEELFTFGFNYGQLGYERKGDIQIGPRKVASLPPRIILQVAASDSATACLLSSNEVIVFHKYAYHKVAFSLYPYPDWFTKSNMYKVQNENRPRKISCSENKFGMMTGWGDIHVWSYPEVDADITLGSLPANHSVASIAQPDRPRRVWTYGGDRTQAIDFALGQNGSVIMLTNGGHVYIGTNKGATIGRNVKWQRIPHLDRVVQVYANPSGAWAAIRSESALTPVIVRPGCLGSDLEQSLSQFHLYCNNEKNRGTSTEIVDDDDDEEDRQVKADPWKINDQGWQDIEMSWDRDVVPLLDLTTKLTNNADTSVSGSHLFDVELQAGKRVLGAHRIILAARSPVLCRAFVDTPRSRSVVGSLVTVEPVKEERSNGRTLYTVLLKVEFTTAVLLLQFLYSDRFDPFWDSLNLPKSIKQYALKVRQELYHLALELSLPTLQAALQYSFTHVCSSSLSKNMDQVVQDLSRFQNIADVRLLLKGGATMDLHQAILGHRSPFFNAMLVRTDEWIRTRQGQRRLPLDGVESDEEMLEVDMKHMDLEAMALVIKYIYTDSGPELFDDTEKDDMNDLIQLVINVLQIADELLMDRLKEVCEKVLSEQVRAKTVVTFLEISLMYAAESLKVTCIDYLCHNIEMALDQRWLEGIEDDILELVEKALRGKQDAFMPYVRSGGYLPDADKVEETRRLVKTLGYQYFVLRGTYKSDVSKPTRPHHERELEQGSSTTARSSSLTTTSALETTTLASTLPPTLALRSLSVSSLPDGSNAPDERLSATQKQERAGSVSQTENGLEWPTLTDSPETEAREIPVLPQRKTSWGQVLGVESLQISRDNNDGGSLEGSFTAKPSLRDILEQEQRQGQMQVGRTATVSPVIASAGSQKTIKMSQKERRKLLLQQQALSSSPELGQGLSPQPGMTPPPVWGKVVLSTNALDVSLAGAGNAGAASGLNSEGSSAGLDASTSVTSNTLSLLDIQQSELSMFRTQPKEVPRVAIATSKPVKETMRTSSTGERTFSEAPWRLDAIPEPLRAVTRHQSQMYPKLESSSGASHPPASSSGSLTGSALFPALGASAPARPNISSNGGSFKGGSGLSMDRATTPPASLSMTGMLSSSPSGLNSMNQHHATSLSSFAIIQNQQLRDRNMLLRARHHKKSLHQIQIEEQAMSQLRSMSLERVRAKATEGTGEWFTCEISERVA